MSPLSPEGSIDHTWIDDDLPRYATTPRIVELTPAPSPFTHRDPR